MNYKTVNNILYVVTPKPDENTAKMFTHVLNVSYEPCNSLKNLGNLQHWAPINELGVWSWEAIFSCMRFLQSIQPGAKLCIHCHAGVNRSQTIAYMWLTSMGLSGSTEQKRPYELNLKRGHINPKTIEFIQCMIMHPNDNCAGILLKSNLLKQTYPRR